MLSYYYQVSAASWYCKLLLAVSTNLVLRTGLVCQTKINVKNIRLFSFLEIAADLCVDLSVVFGWSESRLSAGRQSVQLFSSM